MCRSGSWAFMPREFIVYHDHLPADVPALWLDAPGGVVLHLRRGLDPTLEESIKAVGPVHRRTPHTATG
jgi:hypothetical protein